LLFIGRYSGLEIFPFKAGALGGGTFPQKLEAYDTALAGGQSGEKLDAMLDRLEKDAPGLEPRLSVLKRRRALASQGGRFRSSYEAALKRIGKDFPFSQPIAALSAESLLSAPLTAAAEAELRNYAAVISDPRMASLAFGLYVLSGAMEDPGEAVPRMEALFSAVDPALRGEERAAFLVNFAIRRLLNSDMPGAAALINAILQDDQINPEGIRFAAEFFYDYGEPLRAAQLFSRLPGEENLARQADALALAGRDPRAIWLALISPPRGNVRAASSPDIAARSLYNLAAASDKRDEQIRYLERLIAGNAGGHISRELTLGIIRYTRLLEAPRAMAVLEGTDKTQGLLDLELYRRRMESWAVDRALAETWLLVNRHPQDEQIYQWAAYFFDRQRQYGETALLLREAEHNELRGPWISLHEGLRRIREGDIAGGETLLNSMPMYTWQVPANIARVLEARRSNTAALEHYEIAASMVTQPKDAAKIQLRIARCLRALGRDRELRRVLQYALDLDGENLNARLELHRLDSEGI
jgi:tetratricopeptide (TPR) repeat protein